MDEHYLRAGVRYVEPNPVRAGLARRAWEYGWSSAAAHMRGEDDRLVQVRPMLEPVESCSEYSGQELSESEPAALRLHNRTGRRWAARDSGGSWSG
jgi:putative transposase